MRLIAKKHASISVFALLFSALLCGCNAAKQAASTPPPTSTLTPVVGTWTINMAEIDDDGYANGSFSTTLIASGCPASTILQGPVCFTSSTQGIAGGFTPGQGEWEYSTVFFVDVGVPSTNGDFEVPANSQMALYLAECNSGAEDCAVFSGTGTITNSTVTGTWECNASQAGDTCGTAHGTFTGTVQ
jgi:hypothetical protein